MFARLLAVLLVFGWVSLSALDLLEDLKVGSSDGAYTQSGKSHSRDWSRQPNLANNIVESAASPHGVYTPLLRLNHSEPAIHLLGSSPRVLELHKLHRVFLI
ncbi:MAG: hypothetical protein ACREP5_15410 [Candidatus Binatia bacterium]